MPDVHAFEARSLTFVDDWNGKGRFVFTRPDGSCLEVMVTLPQAALSLEQLSAFVARGVRILHK